MSETLFVPLTSYPTYPPREMEERAAAFLDEMRVRRSVREFSDRPVPHGVIVDCLRTALTAPSGANLQPYHFTVVTDLDTRRRIRLAAEAEEREFYGHRATPEWLEALAPLGTDASKPFLETAPVLIAVFVERYRLLASGAKFSIPYAVHSVGLATGFLVVALHHAGLACLTHTPSPMSFLSDILNRPASERAYLLLVVGYPAEGATVPDIHRRGLADLATFY